MNVDFTAKRLQEEAEWHREDGDDYIAGLMESAVEVIRSQRADTAKLILAEVRAAWDATCYNEEFEERLDRIENKYLEENKNDDN